jgi:3-methylfumaryl-CoA hydratase
MTFVTVGHVIAGPRGTAIVEEQDIVYRSIDGAAVRPADAAPPAPPAAHAREVNPDSVLLFRYSALTGNGHRIHYDRDYATREEGYPGLVVHGPLQAILLADLLTRHRPGARLQRFNFRGQRAAIAGRLLVLEGWGDGALERLRTLDADGAVCMSAEATLTC